MGALVKYNGNLTAPVRKADTLQNMLASFAPELETLLPQWCGVSVAKVIDTALQAAMDNPKILLCSGESIVRSIRQACEFGWNFSKVHSHCALVPFKGQCTLMPMYGGLADLVRRAGDAKDIQVGAVFAGDTFAVERGNVNRLQHVPDLNASHDPKNLTHVYSIAYFEEEHVNFDWMTQEEVNKIKAMVIGQAKSPEGRKKKEYIWSAHYVEMAKKTALRRHSKMLAKSAQRSDLLERAFEMDNSVAGLAPVASVTPAQRADDLEKMLKGEGQEEIIDMTPEAPEPAGSPIERPVMEPEPEPPKPAKPSGLDGYDPTGDHRPATEKQIKRLYAISKGLGATPAEMKSVLRLEVGVDTSRDLDREKIDKVFKVLDTITGHDMLVEWIDYMASKEARP